MEAAIVWDLIVLLAAGFLAGAVCKRMGIPLMVGYLLIGTVIGPGALNLVSDNQRQIELLAEIGVLFLLFTIGLEISINDLRRLAGPVLLGGLTQVTLTITLMTLACGAVGMPWTTSIVIGFATAMSSTVVVFKALDEWGQSGTQHGRRVVGIQLVQDICLVPLLLLLPILVGTEGGTQELASINSNDVAAAVPLPETPPPSVWAFVWLGIMSIAFCLAVAAARTLIQYVLVPNLQRLRSPELTVLFVLVVLCGFSLLAWTIGLPPQMGALAAGLALADNRMTGQIDALVLPFREAFAAVFFVGLGKLFMPSMVWADLWFMLAGLVGVILLKSFTGAVALRLTGLSWRTAMGAGMSLAPLGELSFVLVLQGMRLNPELFSETHYQRVLFYAFGTLVLTPLLVRWGLFFISEKVGEAEIDHQRLSGDDSLREAVVIGLGPVGRQVASRLEISGFDVCAVDLSPVNLQPIALLGFRTVAGDAGDPTILRKAGVHRAQLVVVCAPNDEVNVNVTREARQMNPDAFILVRCHYMSLTRDAEKAGADATVSEETEAFSAIDRVLSKIV